MGTNSSDGGVLSIDQASAQSGSEPVPPIVERLIDARVVDALLASASPDTIAGLARDGLRLSRSGLRGIEIANAVLPHRAHAGRDIAPDRNAIDHELLRESFAAIDDVRAKQGTSEAEAASFKAGWYTSSLINSYAERATEGDGAVAAAMLDALTAYYEVSSDKTKAEHIRRVVESLDRSEACEVVLAAMLAVETEPTNRIQIHDAYLEKMAGSQSLCATYLTRNMREATSHREQLVLANRAFRSRFGEADDRPVAPLPMLFGSDATRFMDASIKRGISSGFGIPAIEFGVSGYLESTSVDEVDVTWVQEKFVALRSAPEKLEAFARGVIGRYNATKAIDLPRARLRTNLFLDAFHAALYEDGYMYGGGDAGSVEFRRALAIAARNLPPLSEIGSERAIHGHLKVASENEDNADLREAFLSTYAAVSEEGYVVKISYLRGVYDSAPTDEGKARVANAIMTIRTDGISHAESHRQIRALRHWYGDRRLRQHLTSLMDSNCAQPTGRCFEGGSMRYN